MRFCRRATVYAIAGMLLAGAVTAPASDREVLAPGYANLQFPAPEPGSYRLPVLWPAADGRLLDSDGRSLQLHDLLSDRVVILSFIYTHCNDINGCPLATFVQSQLQSPIMADPQLRQRVRLITVSFDPARDTPEAMAAFGARFREEGFDWRFLTGSSAAALEPLLAAYDQSTQLSENEQGVISHVLRVLLIDENRMIRNVYNTSFLHVDTVISDLKTVLSE